MSKDPNIVAVVNTYTGEVLEYGVANTTEQAESYNAIKKMIAALERAKDKIKPMVLAELGDQDELQAGVFTWKRRTSHYLTYDLTVMHQQLDEDLFATLVKPDKKAVDEMLADAVKRPDRAAITREQAAELRATMIEDRKPVTTLTLEKDK